MAALNCGQNVKKSTASASVTASLWGDVSYYQFKSQEASKAAQLAAETAAEAYVQSVQCPLKCGIGFPSYTYQFKGVQTIAHTIRNPVEKPGIPSVIGSYEIKATVEWTVTTVCIDLLEFIRKNFKLRLPPP